MCQVALTLNEQRCTVHCQTHSPVTPLLCVARVRRVLRSRCMPTAAGADAALGLAVLLLQLPPMCRLRITHAAVPEA